MTFQIHNNKLMIMVLTFFVAALMANTSWASRYKNYCRVIDVPNYTTGTTKKYRECRTIRVDYVPYQRCYRDRRTRRNNCQTYYQTKVYPMGTKRYPL